MKDRNNPSNRNRTNGNYFRWFVSIAILTFLPMIAAVAKAQADPEPAWVTLAQTAQVGTEQSSTDVTATSTTEIENAAPIRYTVKTAKGLAWIAWVTNTGKTYSQTTTTSTEPNYDSYYPAKAGFEGCDK